MYRCFKFETLRDTKSGEWEQHWAILYTIWCQKNELGTLGSQTISKKLKTSKFDYYTPLV